MSYATLLNEDGVRSEYLIILKPARRVQGFSIFSGSVYSVAFNYGQVIEVMQNATALTEAFTTSLSVGQFFYDVDAQILYVRMSDSSNPSTKFVTATYEIYAGTSAEHFHRIPTDTSTRQVFYDSTVQQAPVVKQTQSDGLFGFIPVQQTEIKLINAEHSLERHVYDSSFNLRKVDVYHFLDELIPGNVKLVMRGTMGRVGYESGKVSISVTDRTDQFNQEFRNPGGTSFWSDSDFPNLDPNFFGRAIRYVYGRVDGFVPVNLDYLLELPTTSENRTWGVRADKTKLNDITRVVAAAPASTATRVYLTSVSGLMVGDSIRVTKATPESTFVTAVGVNFVDVSPAFASGAPVNPNTVFRPTISRVSIIQNNVRYDALYIRDYTQNIGLATDVLGFDFTTSMESNLTLPQTLSPNDKVFCRVYGKQNDVTLGGPALGGDDTDTANLTAPAPILIDLIKSRLGIPETELDSASFTALQAATTEALSFAIPKGSRNDFPTFKQIISDIIQTLLLRLVIDQDTKIRVALVAPLGSEEKTIDELEVQDASLRYEFSYQDLISLFLVEYGAREQPDDAATSGEQVNVVTATSDTARYLHQINKQRTQRSLHLKEADAQVLADHLAAVFGDRQGRLTLSSKNRFFDTELSDTLMVSREKLPGFAFADGTARTRKFSVLSTDKGLRQIQLEMDDQKGVEDADDLSLW